MKKILVLGGAGFIGFHLVEKLSSHSDNQVTVCDNLFRGRLDTDLEHLLSTRPNIRFVNADLTEKSGYELLEIDYDQVYLLAAIVGVRYALEMPDRVVYTNAMIVLQTLEWIKHCRGAKLLFASTSETYAGGVMLGHIPVPTPEEVPLMVTDVTNPRFSYAVSKILGETAVISYSRKFGFPFVIVRYHNVYGPRMGFDHVVSEISMRILRREEPFVIYSPEQRRAFCYVDDAVRATTDLMDCPAANSTVVNVGNDREETRIDDLVNHLFDISGYHPVVEARPASSGSVYRRCPDLSRLRQLTGYEPQVGLAKGLRRAYKWYRKYWLEEDR